ADVANGTVPDYSFYVPDLDDDGHDTGVGFANNYFSGRFGPFLNNPSFMKDLLFVTVFDESESAASNNIYASFVGDSVVPGRRIGTHYDHLNLLAPTARELRRRDRDT